MAMPSVALLLVLAAVTIVIFWYVRDNIRNAERNRHLNKFTKWSIRTVPLLGHMWYSLGSIRTHVRLLEETFAKVDKPFVTWFGVVPSVNLTALEDIEGVLKVCTDRNTYGIEKGTVENGIISQNRERWTMARRLMKPAFGHDMLTQYLSVFNEQGEILVDLLKQKAIKEEFFDLWPFLSNANIDIITENMMGIKSHCQRSGGHDEYSEAISKMTHSFIGRAINPLLYSTFVFQIYSKLTGITHCAKAFHKYPDQAIDKTLQSRARMIEDGEGTSSYIESNDVPKLMIEILTDNHLKSPHTMPREQIRNEMLHLMTAGMEATSNGVGFLMLMYGIHQDTQEAVYQEIKSVMADDCFVTIDDLDRLEYLDKTIKETLRFFSVVAFTLRSMDRTLKLPSGDTIPAGVDVFLHLMCLHKNPSYYPNPEKRDPENFSKEAENARPPNSFAPFGMGLRTCLGSKYAMLDMKVQTIHLLRKYRVITDVQLSDIKVDRDLARHSRHGYVVKLQIRDS